MGAAPAPAPLPVAEPSHWWLRIRRVMQWLVGSLATLAFGAVVTRFSGWLDGPPTYKICLIVDDAGSLANKELQARFKEKIKASGSEWRMDSKIIELEVFDDRGDLDGAREVAANLAARDDVLLVFGHGSSTRTKAALPTYLRAAPPIPAILIFETNPDLLPPKTDDANYYPVFRLHPTDESQSDTAADFAIRTMGGKSFWVVNDQENPVYSGFLTQRFVHTVQGQKKAVVLFSASTTAPSRDILQALNVDCVFFPGSWSNALILIRQIRAIWTSGPDPSGPRPMPKIILTDAAADPRLIENGQADVEGVFVLHPLPASVFQRDRSRAYADEAFEVVQELLSDANKELMRGGRHWLAGALNIHRVSDSRRALRTVMQKAVLEEKSFATLGGKRIRFKSDGVPDGARFNIWQVAGGKFIDVTAEPASVR